MYDKALENKLKNLYPRVIYAPVDLFYSRYLETNNNEQDSQTKLPALSLWRISHEFDVYSARSRMNTPSVQMRRGVHGLSDGDLRQIFTMRISLQYQLDIWAGSDIERDDLFTELMYALTLYPNISINYQGRNYAFSLMLEPADDITDIAQYESQGTLYRISIPIRLPEARLFFYKDVKELRHINIDFSVEGDPLSKEIISIPDNDNKKGR